MLSRLEAGFGRHRAIICEPRQCAGETAVAVLLDATVARGVLLPATMKLLGERSWYLPRRLAWLPRANLDAVDAGAAAVTPP